MIPRLIIVIPCYNEQEVLPITAPQFLAKINQLAAEGLISGDSRVMFVNDGSKDTATTDSPSEIDAIGDEVLSIILRRYREPHLQKSEVLSEIPKGKVNAASKYITQLGYYNLVNMFRLQHAALYKEAHPAAKQEEIAEESGFSSRTAYYKARKSVAAIDDKIVKCVKL